MGGFVHSKEPAKCFAEECKRKAKHLAKMKHTCIHCTDICCSHMLEGWRRLARGAGRAAGSMREVKGAAGVATQAAPSPAPPSTFAVPGGGNCRQDKQGTAGWAAGALGKASPWLAQPAAVTCPAQGHHPVCPPQPRDLVGRCSSSLALAMTGTSGLGQHKRLPAGDGKDSKANHLRGFWRALPTIASRDAAAAVGICQQKSPGVSKAA